MRTIDLLSEPWAITEDARLSVVAAIRKRFQDESIQLGAQEKPPLAAYLDQRVNMTGDAIGRIDVVGALSYRSWWAGLPIKAVRAGIDSLVGRGAKALVLNIDSPGGQVTGTAELATHIAGLPLPTVALVDGLAASAAYCLACACDEVVAIPSGVAGSVGVVAMHIDASKFFADWGLAITLVTAGEGKAAYSDTGPLSEAAHARLQATVDEAYATFVGFVAKRRNKREATIREKWGAHTYSAAKAVELGMVDRIDSLEGVYAALSGRKRDRGATRSEAEVRRASRLRAM